MLVSNGGGKETWWRRCFDNLSSEPKGRNTATFPINELWDLSGTTTGRQKEGSATEGQHGDELRLRCGKLSALDIEIDRRFGSVARGCHAFDRFTQDRSLVPTHVLNVLACRWTCTCDGPWNPVRHGICDVISSCNLFSKSSSACDRERGILGEVAKMQFIWYVYILKFIVIDLNIFS